MFRRFLCVSIQRVLVTGTRNQGDGGITLDGALMDAAGLLPHETVLCTNELSGNQFLASVSQGRRGRGELILGGPVARQGSRGDWLTIHRYDSLSQDQVDEMSSQVVLIDMSAEPRRQTSRTRVAKK